MFWFRIQEIQNSIQERKSEKNLMFQELDSPLVELDVRGRWAPGLTVKRKPVLAFNLFKDFRIFIIKTWVLI